MDDVHVISAIDAACGFPCMSTQLLSLRVTALITLSRIPGFTQIA